MTDLSLSLDVIDLTEVSTDFPCLAEGDYRFSIKECELLPNKQGDGTNLRTVFALESDSAVDRQGNPVALGYTVTEYMGLTVKNKRTADQIKRDLAKFMEGTRGAKGIFGDPANYLGAQVILTIKIENTENWGYQNRIKAMKFPQG